MPKEDTEKALSESSESTVEVLVEPVYKPLANDLRNRRNVQLKTSQLREFADKILQAGLTIADLVEYVSGEPKTVRDEVRQHRRKRVAGLQHEEQVEKAKEARRNGRKAKAE